MREHQIEVVKNALNAVFRRVPDQWAIDVLDAIEAQGMTVYKRKVMVNARRPNSSQPMTDDLRKAIQIVHADNPDMTQSEIAALFNVNSGRVAEVLR